MKRLLLSILVLTHMICGFGKGSELPDSSFIWTIRSIGWGNCNGVSTYRISSDTLIGDRVYKQIFATSDSVLIENVYKTRLGIGARQGELWEYWIEDIGCLSGLFYSCYFIFDQGYELTCTYLHDEFYHNFGYDGLCGCYPRTTIESGETYLQVSIYPNPSNGIINIKNPLQIRLTLNFYSMEGKLIDQMVLDGNETKNLTLDYNGNIAVRIEGNEIYTTQIIQMIK